MQPPKEKRLDLGGIEALSNTEENSHSTASRPEVSADEFAPPAPTGYGAAPGEWTHFDLLLELTEDLLPVVSDPTAKKSPLSKMAGVGKTPSLFNKRGEMVGFPKWTDHHATFDDIEKWSKDSRLGICIQTRNVRGLDIDIGDFDEATDVEAFIDEYLGFKLPARRRGNSTKFLMPFILPGDMTKRRFKTKTEGNFIELLATGQQFIACGTHTSGVRYGWDGGLPQRIPTLTSDQFEALWSALNEKFGSEASVSTRAGRAPTIKRRLADADDAVGEYLEENWEVFDVTDEGRVDLLCPWHEGHSVESGESSTSWFLGGTGGIARGHFKCLHASCAHRTDQDFLDAIGYSSHGFDVIEVDDNLPAVIPPPKFATISSGANTGKAKNTLENVTAALFRPDVCGYQLRFDTFRHGVMLSAPAVDEWRALSDVDYSELRLQLVRPGHGHNGFEEIGKETIRDAVDYVASKTTFDTATLWLESLQWDGVPRIERTLQKYFGTKDTPYHRAVSLYLWTALAGRVMVPGIKADMVPVAVGKQGARKSSTVAAIVPARDFFIEADLSRDDDDLARLMRGKLVVELAELNGLRKKEAEHIKTFIAKQEEEWTPKFKEFNTRYARRCIFFGTTNEPEFLVDKTGHRRWLPFDVGACDPDAMANDRDQLWAEALILFNQNGIVWAEAETLAKDVHEQYVERDPWEEAVINYLLGDGMGEPAPVDTPFTVVQVLRSALCIPPSQINKGHKDRMSRVLSGISDKLRLKKCKPYIDGVQHRGYVRSVE